MTSSSPTTVIYSAEVERSTRCTVIVCDIIIIILFYVFHIVLDGTNEAKEIHDLMQLRPNIGLELPERWRWCVIREALWVCITYGCATWTLCYLIACIIITQSLLEGQ